MLAIGLTVFGTYRPFCVDMPLCDYAPYIKLTYPSLILNNSSNYEQFLLLEFSGCKRTLRQSYLQVFENAVCFCSVIFRYVILMHFSFT